MRIKHINIHYLLSILLIFAFNVQRALCLEDVIYKGEKQSLINFDEIKADDWLDYRHWLSELNSKIKDPLWKKKFRDNSYKEIMGRALACVGECRIYRGTKYAKSTYRSSIKEGDEVQTLDNSYLWIFLMNGTMVRLAPNTSVSFNEFNISTDGFFLYVRINQGLVLWSSRDANPLPESSLSETDALFLPLRTLSANFHKEKKTITEEQFSLILEDDQTHLKHVQKLNCVVKLNNKFFKEKESYSLIVMPNGSIYGKNLNFFGLVENLGSSYIKSYASTDTEGTSEVEFYYRGYKNKDAFKLKENSWYKVDSYGKAIEEFSEGDKIFGLPELLTKRITSVLLARETLLLNYSLPLFDKKITNDELIIKHGYRLWDNSKTESKINELDEHIKFLKEYTRRSETTNLNSGHNLYSRIKNAEKELNELLIKGDDMSSNDKNDENKETFKDNHYTLALNTYINFISKNIDTSNNVNQLLHEIWYQREGKNQTLDQCLAQFAEEENITSSSTNSTDSNNKDDNDDKNDIGNEIDKKIDSTDISGELKNEKNMKKKNVKGS
ncbi:MAG: hypothetical protein HQK51_07270 [Oligoflexia bacterium]|nr:hypothetical protein [Oligoflexia bacterium]